MRQCQLTGGGCDALISVHDALEIVQGTIL